MTIRPITHNDLRVLHSAFSYVAEDDQDNQILGWLTDILEATAERPNWPHDVVVSPTTSVSGFTP